MDRAIVEAFRRDGYVVVDGLLGDDELDRLAVAVSDAVARRKAADTRALHEKTRYEQSFLQCQNLWEDSVDVRPLTFHPRVGEVAAALIGAERVRLWHDQALFKEPGGGFTPWHQDQFYWPLDTEHTVTLWMPLVPVSVEMGPMTFASGSHRLGKLCDLPIGDESEAVYDAAVAERGLRRTAPEAFAPGDATFHAGWTLHRAPPNRTALMREVMTVIYFADGARVGPLDHPNRRFDRDVWLPGCEPGEPAASAKNPVLWRAGRADADPPPPAGTAR
jgi:ectoine hydroxylase-related dioxygenase (phytanoyl-CoA dioxygenase family)